MALQLGSMFMIVVFVFGVPFFWLVSLLRVRESLHRTGPEGEPTMAAQNFDFLIGAYKPKFYLVSARSTTCAPRRALGFDSAKASDVAIKSAATCTASKPIKAAWQVQSWRRAHSLN